MTNTPISQGNELTIATRAWTTRGDEPRNATLPWSGHIKTARPRESWKRTVLIFDTETTTDATQRLTFGCYRFGEWQDDGTLAILEEGFLYADTLATGDPDGYAELTAFVAEHEPDTDGFYRNRSLMLRSQRDFLDNVFWPVVKQDALIVGFNLPFDLSRIAYGAGAARGKHEGGFSFVLWQYPDPETGEYRENQFRPRVRVTQIDSKRSRMDITSPKGRPIGADGKPVSYRPGFLDLRTLAFALTDRGHTLKSACEAFNVDQGKAHTESHGRINADYIAYARQDVKASGFLLEALRADFDRHPIDLDPCKAYSPASLAKAYYRAMGITPRRRAQPDFPPEILGYAMSAYYGGRAECAIRRTPVPIVYTDVLSMYPTVNANMGLWRYHIARRIDVRDDTENVRELLERVTVEMLLNPETWERLHFFAQIVPNGDIVPVRASYSAIGGTFNIGVNPLHDRHPHWYAGPDLVASALLTGTMPTILMAFRLVPVGKQRSLRPVALRGTVTVDPAADDFFRTVIEERKRARHRDDLSGEEKARLDKFLKVLANSGSYGVFVESNPQELASGETVPVQVYGPEETPFLSETVRPETPGTYSFPPIAALITAGARLVLALIERMVTDAGGSYAFCDTDSMAIVATETGGLIPCAGGSERMPDGRAAIRALSWKTVDRIVSDLATLNPYSRDVVPGSLLEVEDVNFDPDTGTRRQVWCVSIAAKRYALFTIGHNGNPTILPGSTRHGLGFLIDPRDSTDDGAKRLAPWEHALWEGMVRERLGLPVTAPPWHDRAAVMRHNISTPSLLKAFDAVNRGKPYADQVKPFNFMLAVPLEDGGRPRGIDADARFTLITSYESNPVRWLHRNWYNAYNGESFRITTRFPGGGAGVAGVKSLGSVAMAYPFHPESKRTGADGQPCEKRTEGVLNRRPVRAAGMVSIGKEAHKLEERDLVSGLDELQSVFLDPRRDPWHVVVLPRLRLLASTLDGRQRIAELTHLSSRALRDIITGRSLPRRAVRIALVRMVASELGELERRCASCGCLLTGSDPRQKYCSSQCRKRNSRGCYGL